MHDMNAGKTWKYPLSTRILIGFVVAFMLGIAGLLFSIPAIDGSSDHSADWIVDLTGVIMLGFAIFMTFGLVAVVRTRISLDAETLDATLADGHNWLLVPHFREVRLSVEDIGSVERRTEVFRTLGMSSMRDALSVVTKRGERIGLFSNTLGTVSTLPLDEVANAIASAAGVPVTDDGTVATKGSGLYGAAASSWKERPLDPASATKARSRATRTMQIVFGLVFFTFALRACIAALH
jgi:hypothetical protein